MELNFFKMKAEALYNKKSKEQLKKELGAETFDRITCSFYRYVDIEKLGDDIEIDDITLEAIAHDNNCDVNVLRL